MPVFPSRATANENWRASSVGPPDSFQVLRLAYCYRERNFPRARGLSKSSDSAGLAMTGRAGERAKGGTSGPGAWRGARKKE